MRSWGGAFCRLVVEYKLTSRVGENGMADWISIHRATTLLRSTTLAIMSEKVGPPNATASSTQTDLPNFADLPVCRWDLCPSGQHFSEIHLERSRGRVPGREGPIRPVPVSAVSLGEMSGFDR